MWMLETNLDDVPAEVIGYTFDQLLAAGALDAFLTPIHMKKNRPGVLLGVLAPEEVLARWRRSCSARRRRWACAATRCSGARCSVSR